MAHDCPACGQACYCDGDDTWMESAWTLMHCRHDCEPEDDDLDYGAEDAPRCTGTPTRSDVCDDTSCPKHGKTAPSCSERIARRERT